MTIEFVVLAVSVLALNVMDSVTTELCFRQYPDKDLKAEGNPLMRWLMLKSRVLAEVVKHVGVFWLVVLFIGAGGGLLSLRMLAIMLGIVVVNNTVIVVSRAIARRKVASPSKLIMTYFHVPERFMYLLTLIIILSLTMGIYSLVWGAS